MYNGYTYCTHIITCFFNKNVLILYIIDNEKMKQSYSAKWDVIYTERKQKRIIWLSKQRTYYENKFCLLYQQFYTH